MTHVKTSPYYPQSNGKIERFHRSLKSEGIRPGTPLTVDDAKRVVKKFVEEYNTVRLHSALGYITPLDKLEGREQEIFAERDRKLMEARQKRAAARLQSRNKIAAEKTTMLESVSYSTDVNAEDRALLGSNLSAGLMLDVSSAVGPAPTAPAAYV